MTRRMRLWLIAGCRCRSWHGPSCKNLEFTTLLERLLLRRLMLKLHPPHVIIPWFYPTPRISDNWRQRSDVFRTIRCFKRERQVALWPHRVRCARAFPRAAAANFFQKSVRGQQQASLLQQRRSGSGVLPPENHEKIVGVSEVRCEFREQCSRNRIGNSLRNDPAAAPAPFSEYVRFTRLKDGSKSLRRRQHPLSPHVSSHFDDVTIPHRCRLLCPLHDPKRERKHLILIVSRRSAEASRLV